ncbi:Rhs family protein (plasmid) [Enterobacter hormaechei subsp. hoffmannii]|nr:Rhs family protein [Enterobacter hormaechei subsp. hoffmannii]
MAPDNAGIGPAYTSGQVVWKASYSPFGKASITTITTQGLTVWIWRIKCKSDIFSTGFSQNIQRLK